ncbi:DHH family phosphoesterase [Hominifimenecus sp. rT4P-3]|uniref:DHH family phosphoesterase n=1 Tax=Hominifimenecus sp. rT4P-3 TaxID=3242979 RepID=UPI003DA51074
MKRIEEVLDGAARICIAGHIHPDGDCVGACLGLYNYIREICPDALVQVYLEPFSEHFAFLKGAETVNHEYPKTEPYDVCFALDCGDKERLGAAGSYWDAASKKVCIDHHVTNTNFGDVNHICPKASSTSEVLYELMDDSRITREIAECLYVGIVHDTGVFKHSNTEERTMAVAGRLMAKGVSSSYIIDETFYKKTFAQNKALGRALGSAKLWLNGKFIAGAITARDMQELGLLSRELDGIVDQLRVTSGVQAAAFLYESEAAEQKWKVSLRANEGVDVSKIAVLFGGGGHVKAAGCTMSGEWTEIADQLAKLVKEQL